MRVTMLYRNTSSQLIKRGHLARAHAPLAHGVLYSSTTTAFSKQQYNPQSAQRLPVFAPILTSAHSFSSSTFASAFTTRGTVSDGKPSANEIQQKTVGVVTKKLRVLDMAVVKQILDELRSVDVNSDERYVS
jgi:hypothetical protein